MSRNRTEQDALPFLNLLPNVVTILGLCAGLTAIRFVLVGNYEMAGGLILLAALIDGLDGRLARRLKATSDFGAELDSLADFLSFGVAPGLLVFEHLLGSAGGVAWIFVLVYVSCCCLRLARFNVTKEEAPAIGPTPRAHFVGVPAPAGAMLALLPVFLTFEGIADASSVPLLTAFYLGLVGAAMISRLPTFSPKSILVPRDRIAWLLIATAVLVGTMLTRFWLSMILIDLIYAGFLLRSAFVAARQSRT